MPVRWGLTELTASGRTRTQVPSMPRYLLVPTTASSLPALVARARELDAGEGRAAFVLLTPLPRTTRDRDVAEHLASANDVLAVAQLQRARLRVERSSIGDRAPLLAIQDELRAHPGAYDAVVLASRTPGRLARLAARDDHWRAQSLPVPVIHVFEEADARPLPRPLTYHLGRIVSGPARFGRWIARQLERPRLGIAVMCVPIVVYLTVGMGLALFVNRAFLFNEVLALVLYAAMISAVVILERPPRPAKPPAHHEEPTRVERRR